MDSAADATDLDAVVVTGERSSGYESGTTSGATRLDLSARETPQSVSVVTRSQMDDFGLDSINDALNATTGVNVEQVETDRTYYTARGFDITNFQRDGLGLPLPYGIQNGDIDTALYERIEVLRGANGLMSSTGNPSATVNFVRKRPGTELEGSARLTLGSWDSRRVDLDVSSPLSAAGTVRGRVVAAYQDNESYLDRYSRDKQVYYGVIEADLGPATTLTVGASHQKNKPRSPMWGALPLYYSDGTPTDYDVSTSTAADWSFWKSEDTRAFAELAHGFGNDWQLKAAFNYEDKQDDTQLFYIYGTPDRETGEGLFAYPSDYDGRFEARFVDAYATGPLMLGGRPHDVVIGANWTRGTNQEVSWYGNDVGTPLPDLGTWDGHYPKPTFDAYSDGASYDYRRESLYATVRWNLADRFKLITGANRSRVETRGISYGTPNTVEETRTTPFAGAVFDLGTHYSLYGSYGEIFSQQAQTDIDNRLLGPVTGSNAEMGLKGEWLGGGINASFAVFRARQRNLAESAGFDTVAGRTYYAGVDAESTGYEFDIAGRLAEHWQVAGGFTHLRLEDNGGNDTRTYVPRELLRLSTTVQVPQVQGLKLGASLKWQSDIHRDAVLANGEPVVIRQDAYALLGLMARYDFAPSWNATLNVDNVTNEKYIPSLYWEQGFYGEPRNVSLSFGYRF
ncbi:MAG TPA: TonB-dependent siderophore receptor [Lysobacter sp.]